MFVSAPQMLACIDALSGDYYGFLSVIRQHFMHDQVALREAFEAALRHTHFMSDAQSRADDFLTGQPSDVAPEWMRWSTLRREFAGLVLTRTDGATAKSYRDKLTSLQQRLRESERRLAHGSASFAKELRQRTITTARLANALPPNVALVEIVQARDYDFSKAVIAGSRRYLVFVLTDSGEMGLTDLGDRKL